MTKRRLVPAAFLALAALDGITAMRTGNTLVAHADARHGLLALHALLRTIVALAFAFFAWQRAEPHRHARQPLAFAACAVAMLVVVPFGDSASRMPSVLLLAGDAVAVAGSVWIFASVLALGRCFGILPEARGLVTHGPYRLVRHPVYLGEIAAMTGLVIAAPSFGHAVMLAVFVLAQLMRMGMEERALSAAFPEYATYAQHTSRLVPLPRHAVPAAGRRRFALAPDFGLGRAGGSSVMPARRLDIASVSPDHKGSVEIRQARK